MKRVSRVKFFIGSTLEEINGQVTEFFLDNLCPGNLIKTDLYMLNDVYQYEVWYCVLVSDEAKEIKEPT